MSLNGTAPMAVIAIQNVFDPSQVYLIDCNQKDHTLNGATFCDELQVLPPGVYEIIVQTQDPNCHSEFDHYKVVVEEGQTVEVHINIVCGGNGGLDVIVTENEQPIITGISFLNAAGLPGNKFVCQECAGGPNADERVVVQVTDSDTACADLIANWTAVDSAGNDVTSTLLSDFQLVSDTTCQFSALINAAAPIGDYDVTFTVSDGVTSPTSLTFPIHVIYCGCGEAIDLIKFTNGQDANLPPGPSIPVGSPVTWTYFVTNTGTQTLSNVIVTDSKGVVVNCPKSTLAPGESMVCIATGTALPGQYSNTGTATGTPPIGIPVSDTDPSHYVGIQPSIDIVKYTNGEDANSPPGPTIPVGDPVNWTYVVTNTGDVTLTNVTVEDSKGEPVTCPKTTLAPGETMTCTASATAQPGQYENFGTATGTPPGGPPVTDTDPSHYFGLGTGPAIRIVKYTNGQDANTPTGPLIPVGAPVNWSYVVTNVGAEVLINVQVTDSQGVIVTCPLTTLNVGQAMTCTAVGTAMAGQYANVGTATGTGQVSATNVIDTDPSHYFGAEPLACLGEAATFALLGLDNGSVIVNSANTVIGDFGYSDGVVSTVNQKIGGGTPPDIWNGGAYVHSGATFAYSTKDYLPSDGIFIGGASDIRLDQANADAAAAALAWSALSADQTLGNVTVPPNLTINANPLDPIYVVAMQSMNCNGGTVTLNGTASQSIIIRVADNFDFSQCQVVLTGGITADRVVWYFPDCTTPSQIVINKSTTVFNGTLFAPCGNVTYHNPATFNGAIIALDINVHSDFNLTGVPSTVPCQ